MEGPHRRRSLKTRDKPPDKVDRTKELPPRGTIRPGREGDSDERGDQQRNERDPLIALTEKPDRE